MESSESTKRPTILYIIIGVLIAIIIVLIIVIATKKCDECNTNNPDKCPWVTSCRAGNTTLYRDSNIYAWAGTAYHSLNGRNDRIYVLQGNDAASVSKYGVTWVKVYIPSYDDYYGDEYVYIAKNCLGPYNKVCPYTQCPG